MMTPHFHFPCNEYRSTLRKYAALRPTRENVLGFCAIVRILRIWQSFGQFDSRELSDAMRPCWHRHHCLIVARFWTAKSRRYVYRLPVSWGNRAKSEDQKSNVSALDNASEISLAIHLSHRCRLHQHFTFANRSLHYLVYAKRIDLATAGAGRFHGKNLISESCPMPTSRKPSAAKRRSNGEAHWNYLPRDWGPPTRAGSHCHLAPLAGPGIFQLGKQRQMVRADIGLDLATCCPPANRNEVADG